MRRKQGVAAQLAIALVLSGFALPAGAQEVTISYAPIINPWKVAIADGTFETATGYAIEWRTSHSIAEQYADIASGTVNIAVMGSAAIARLVSEDAPVQLFWILERIDAAEALVARQGSGIVAPRDLKGKRIAVPFGETTHFHALFALEQFAISVSEVSLHDMHDTEIAESWNRREIDAAFVWQPVLDQLLESGSVLITSGQLGEWGRPTFDGLVVRSDFAEANQDFMCRFVQTIAAADAAYRDDPASFGPGSANAAKVAELGDGDAATVASILGQYEFLPLDRQAGPDWLGGGAADVLAATGQFLENQGLVDESPQDYARFVTSEIVDAAATGCPATSR